MSEIDHSQRAHAILSASGASRWLNCTPSAILESKVKEETSSFAEEGTLAHELGEVLLRERLEQKSTTRQKWVDLKKAEVKRSPYYNAEMLDHISRYVDYIEERFQEDPRSTLIVEERTSFADVVPHGFGTNDAIIITNRRLIVIDLKYGKGVAVSAEDNSQLKLYAYGALMANDINYDLGPETVVELVIYQPRLDNISSYELTAEALTGWARGYVKERAAIAIRGEGEQVVGSWCKFCKVAATCRAMAAYADKEANADFADPKLISKEELPYYLGRVEILTGWVKALEAHALSIALDGEKLEGYKLVEGRSNRKWTDEDAIIKELRAKKYTDAEILNIKLKGITDIETLVGKKDFPTLLSKYITKPAGSPTLVPASDKRAEYIINKEKQINNDFKD